MRVGLSIASDVPASAPDLQGALVGAELLPYDHPCDVRVAWCRALSDVPVLAAFAARAPLYVMLESPLTVEETKRALSSGILEVIDFGSRSERLARLSSRIARRGAVDQRLSEAIRERGLIAHSWPMKRALAVAANHALYSNEAVLILGETGTGKEQVARLVHALDPLRKDKPFVVVDCTSLSEGLAGSELFGHERGSFTGAVQRHVGAFETARGGVVFLDELGELSLALQAKLLRVLQEKRFRRIGATQEEPCDFRLICATHRDLASHVTANSFRADLYYRVSSLTLNLPTLAERDEDILPLARHFLSELLVGSAGCTNPVLQLAVLNELKNRSFPGNVRELRQVMARAAANYPGVGPLGLADLDAQDLETTPGCRPSLGHGETLADFLRRALLDEGQGVEQVVSDLRDAAYELALAHASGNTGLAAELLKRSQRDVQKHIKARRSEPTFE
jgi:transcriptional regulator with GAF, ATPase, and Fis domain